MVAPDTMALVVRQRGGPNLIVHTRGIPGTLVHRACEEAVTIMGRFALGRGQTDIDGSGDIHPKFAHDRLLVLSGRYAVVYRLVYKVWVMAVTTEHSNSLVPVLEVDHDVISRNYQEVYFMMGAILKHQGADLQKSQAEALANIYSYIADTREKKSKSATDVTKRVVASREGRRKLTDVDEMDSSYCFQMPDEFKQLLNPVAATVQMGFGRPSPVDPFSGLSDAPVLPISPAPLVESNPVVQPVPTDLTDLDALLGNPTPVVVQPRSVEITQPVPSPAAVESGTSWFDFGTEQKLQPISPIQPPTAQPASPSRSGPLLYLMERWEGAFEGSHCTRSNAYGEVGLRKHIWKSFAGKELQFRLIPASNAPEQSRGVTYLIKSAQRNTARTSLTKEGILLAKMKPAPQPYLKYRLLPGLYDVPVRLQVSAAIGSFRENSKCLILLIQLSANSRSKSVAHGVIASPMSPSGGCLVVTREYVCVDSASARGAHLHAASPRIQPETELPEMDAAATASKSENPI